jgi:hypothetical protein
LGRNEGPALCLTRLQQMHKTSTREGIARKVARWGVKFEVIAELQFDLPASYEFHKKNNVTIAVDLVRLEVPAAWRQLDRSDDAHLRDLVLGLRELVSQVGSNSDIASDEAANMAKGKHGAKWGGGRRASRDSSLNSGARKRP